ncbi:DUF5572 domain-containing protein [Aspergillus homomorphus CBS 101889]|uniref:Uncharacterized protein n=1 Tax=Aspergillus homomorphus (strain CBS 101889) TaxID=1450537 RepID=A0A395HHU8_ASPHC|nr:hypothetical protein BO97DRAFT_378802 [Aspergillus homomorphus CBS 101889]RAL07320.1 hypothetical protein BO97DRAFT_378802 [Aspergillus homomorphus CBS 101889]
MDYDSVSQEGLIRSFDKTTDPHEAEHEKDIKLFEKLRLYPFEKDPEFALGLSIILGHPGTPASKAEIDRDDDITLQAKCFYFSRKEKLEFPVNVAGYQAWLQARPTAVQASTVNQQQSSVASAGHANSRSGQAEPAYPSSFAHIVELITTGQPIPGIQQVPDTVLSGQDTPSTKSKRRKPWEQENGEEPGN